MKKIVALVLSLVMVLGLATTAFAATAYTPAEMDADEVSALVNFDAKLTLEEKESDEEFAVYTVLMVAKKACEYDGEDYEKGDDFDLVSAAGNDEFVIVDGTGDYEFAVIDGKKITYLADAEDYNGVDYVEAAWETKANVVKFPVMPNAAAEVKCDTYYTTNPAVTEFFWYEGVLYTAAGADDTVAYVFNVDGVAVDVAVVAVDDASALNYVEIVTDDDSFVVYTGHNYNVASKGSTYVTDATVTGVTCDYCKASFAYTPYGATVAKQMFGEYNYFALEVTDDLTLWVEIEASGTAAGDATTAPEAGDKVESAETFDAGIAMYVGMSVMAAVGSAVVLKKKD